MNEGKTERRKDKIAADGNEKTGQNRGESQAQRL